MSIVDPNEIGHRQQLIMQCVWDAGGVATVPEIIERLENKCGKRLTRQAMNTFVLILVDKGFLGQGKKIGKAYTYHALISEEEYRVREVERFANLTFGGSPSALFATMLQTSVSKEEMNKIRELLDKNDG